MLLVSVNTSSTAVTLCSKAIDAPATPTGKAVFYRNPFLRPVFM